ncbi:MAG TPA: hypothetical protein VGE62_00115 [Candidatus Paceibacterota bacterium]
MSTITITQTRGRTRAKAGAESLQLFNNFNKLSLLSFGLAALFVGYFLLAVTGLFDFSSRTLIFFAGIVPAMITVSSLISLKQLAGSAEKGRGISLLSIGLMAVYLLSGIAILGGFIVTYLIFG